MGHVQPFMGIILPYANFALFIFLAWWFFRKPAISAARKKREEFETQMQDAAEVKNIAKKRLTELSERLANLDNEIAEMNNLAEQAAEADSARVISDAENLGKHLKEEAKRIAQAEVDKARADLRCEIVDSVRSQVAGKVRSDLDGKAHLTLMRKKISVLKDLRAEG